ncbi:MAG: hypothetical protein QOH88_8 [Verrucomicrobiota bacterium]|jgi:hypothetical protein
MKRGAVAAIVFLLGIGTSPAADRPRNLPASGGDALIEIPAAPENGFNFPYLLFIPNSALAKRYGYLLVEPNNSGHLSDDFEIHRAAAIALARDNSVGNFVAKRLGLPFLVPIFPRPASAENVQTQSLDRDTILIAAGPLRRLDLQLLSMVADARPRLEAIGYPVEPRFLLNGFSAAGLFANRFTFLHPHATLAAAYGGLNGFIMLPVTELKSRALNYPLGIADLEKITGYAFDQEAYQALPQFAYMSAGDNHDAVLHEAGTGHGTNGATNTEVADFFRTAIEAAEPKK